MGVDFDKIYYESQTYLEGKGKVMEGLEKGISIAVKTVRMADLTKDGWMRNYCFVRMELPSI